jgi:hypothetical protein
MKSTTGIPETLKLFLDLSSHLSGFSETELLGTGMLETYYDEVNLIIGQREMGEFLSVYFDLKQEQGNIEQKIDCHIMSSSHYGPIARNIIRLWYIGSWKQLPSKWRNTYGATSFDTDHVVSAEAYQEGLVWIAGGAHPMGAKQQGFGAWAIEPTEQRIGGRK